MTRKHFNAIAQSVHRAIQSIPLTDEDEQERTLGVLTDLAQDIADFCYCENPGFNRTRFLTACGL